MSLSQEIEDRLKVKCDMLADAFADDIGNICFYLLCFYPKTYRSLYVLWHLSAFMITACDISLVHRFVLGAVIFHQ